MGSTFLKVGDQLVNEENWKEVCKNAPLPAKLTFNFDYIAGVVEFPPEHFCSKCKGKKCIHCGKTGLFTKEKELRCERCNGSGQKGHLKITTNCSECLGTGLGLKSLKEAADQDKVYCTNCKGSVTTLNGKNGNCSKCVGRCMLYVVDCKKCQDNTTHKKKHCLEGIKLIHKICKKCEGKGGSIGKFKECTGTGLNFSPDNPYLPEDILCSKFKRNKCKKGKCDRCSNGKMYRMSCYECEGKKERVICGKCHDTGFNYRKLGFLFWGRNEEALAILEEVRDNPGKLCSNCHGKGCRTCKKSGLDLQKANLREKWQTVQSSCSKR